VYGSNLSRSATAQRFAGLGGLHAGVCAEEDPEGTSGVRALDFQGTAALQAPGAGANVPEPTSLIGLMIGGVALLAGAPATRPI